MKKDELEQIEQATQAIHAIANAITDQSASPGNDDLGKPVGCLTEALKLPDHSTGLLKPSHHKTTKDSER